MPIYNLFCEDCDWVFERICKINEIVKCGKCGKKMKRLPTQTSFILKGSGWAKDGYARKGE